MPEERHPHSPARPTGDTLDGEALRAFEAYFAAEQANLEALGRAASEDPAFADFHRDILAAQRRSLATLAFRIATLLPDAAATPSMPPAPPALIAILSQNRARRARALARAASFGARRHTGVLAAGIAAAAIVAVVLLASRTPISSASSVIAPRPAVAAAAIAADTAPTPQPGVLEYARIVAIYGHPYEPITGILGKYPPEQAAQHALRLAREAEAADGRPTVGALHITVHVAQAQQTTDGTYLERLGERGTQPWVDAARANRLLLIVDTQLGWSDALTETKRLEPLLRLPFVHLALDPEFATKDERVAPGQTIGTLDAASINEVQAYLGEIVRRDGLPRKMLIIHQFRGDMLCNADRFAADPDVEIVIDMDGFGTPGLKLAAYEQFALAPYSERPAIKLFFEWDEPLITPRELADLARPPAIVIYQ